MWQQDSYLGELEAKKAAVWQEVAELRELQARMQRDRDLTAQEFHSSQERFDRETARLTELNTELAVVERQLKDTRNEILLLRRSLAGTKSKVLALEEEFTNREAELFQLRQEAKRLQQETEPLESRSKEALHSRDAFSRKHQGLSSAVEHYEVRRSKLVKEIEELLTSTETEREGILGEMHHAAIALMNRIVERDRVKHLVAREAASVATLRESVSRLDRKLQSIQEAEMLRKKRSALESEIFSLEMQVESMDLKMEGLQNTRVARQEELERVSRESSEIRSIIQDLEASVGPYDELVSRVTEAETRLAAQRELIEKGMKALDHLLIDNGDLECELQAAQERFNVLVKLASELFSTGSPESMG